MILSPYIDLRYPILETFGDYLNYHCRGFREEVFVFTLDYLGWGRCGLHGEGSSVVGVGEYLIQGDDPVGGGWRVLLQGAWRTARCTCWFA